MIIWIDAQLSPALAKWFRNAAGIEAYAVRDLNLRDASDHAIFSAACVMGHVIMSKDIDFVELVSRLGPPPQVVHVTCGNVTNDAMTKVLNRSWAEVEHLLSGGASIVELG